jgi:peptidoglycan/LPS O-acetylase OafA/YrhL
MIRKLLAVLFVVAIGVVALAATDNIDPKTWTDFMQYVLQIGLPLGAAVAIGFKNPKELLGKKTTWVGLSAIVGAIAALASGSIDVPTAMYSIVAGLAVIFLRDGMTSIEKKQEEVIKATEMAASKERVRGF